MEYNGKLLRHELKYFINYHEYKYLTARLSTMLARDKNSKGDGYTISSLYFDDVYNSALEEKESGIEFRKKYRIRIYNREDKKISLECKQKYGEYISKSSMKLTKEQYYTLLEGGDISFLLQSQKDMPKAMFADIKCSLLQPVVIVEYDREPFVLDEGNVRITFDKNLRAGISSNDMFERDLVTADAIDPGLMILEVKFDNYLPDYVKGLLQIASHNRSAASKYVMCRYAKFGRVPASKYMVYPHVYTSFTDTNANKNLIVPV